MLDHVVYDTSLVLINKVTCLCCGIERIFQCLSLGLLWNCYVVQRSLTKPGSMQFMYSAKLIIAGQACSMSWVIDMQERRKKDIEVSFCYWSRNLNNVQLISVE